MKKVTKKVLSVSKVAKGKTSTGVKAAKKTVKKDGTGVKAAKKAVKKAATVLQDSVWGLRSKTTGKIAAKVYENRRKARTAAGKLSQKVTVLKLTASGK